MAENWMDNVDGSTLEDSLASLARLVTALDETTSEVDEIKAKLKEAEERKRMLEEEQIPNILHQHGLSELKLADGRKVVVSTDLRARIPAGAAARRIVLDWISTHGGGPMIKDELTVEEPSPDLVDALVERGDTFTRAEKVNTNSFQAFLREMLGMKKGFEPKIQAGEVPAEAGLFIYNKTKIQ